MQLHLTHHTRYRYGGAATLIVQALRMWPVASAGQRVRSWRVEVDGKPLLPTCNDGFGNPVATHTLDRAVESVQIVVRGLVETSNQQGVHRGELETLPAMFYQAGTALTECTPEIAELAASTVGTGNDIERLHRLCHGVRNRIDYLAEQTHAETTAAQALALGVGVCQDHAHVLISAARSLGYAARYVSGYLCPLDATASAASHAWAEIHVADLGWVGFDAANRQSPDERYVRIAIGRDYRDAAPVRGVRRGGTAETLEVQVQIAEATSGAQ